MDFGVRQEGIDRIVDGDLIYDTELKPLSSIEKVLIHCNKPIHASLSFIYFSGKMGKGYEIFNDVDPSPIWFTDDVDIEQIFPTIRKIVCNT